MSVSTMLIDAEAAVLKIDKPTLDSRDTELARAQLGP
jgi:hypothetical protein